MTIDQQCKRARHNLACAHLILTLYVNCIFPPILKAGVNIAPRNIVDKWQKKLCETFHDLSIFGLRLIATAHFGLLSPIIRGLDSLLLYLVKVTKPCDSIRTVCNQLSRENRALIHKVLPYSALAHFITQG